jgi:hypothetical protein
MVNYQGNCVTDDYAKAEAFNDCFQSIFGDHSQCQMRLEDKLNAPIHKKEKHEEVLNHWPVPLLSLLSKIQEKCVAVRLVPVISNQLYQMQHGFQKDCHVQLSCLKCFMKLERPWTKA